jgi:hypothetical protein
MDRRAAWLAVLSGLAAAQTAERQTTVYTFDPSGRRVAWSASRAGDSSRSETVGTLNGRPVELERVDERVVTQNETLRVVERLVTRHDPGGRPLPPEKVLIEERRQPDGRCETVTSLYRGDLNGRLALAERALSSAVKDGGWTRVETRLERPGLGGGMELAERRTLETREAGNLTSSEEQRFRPDANGRLALAWREESETRKEDGRAEEQRRQYVAVDGALTLAQEVRARSEPRPGGELREEVILGPAAPGRPAEPGRLSLRERRVVEKAAGPGGSVVESLSVQRPGLADGRLGPLVKVSETVCRGTCGAQP